MSEPTQLSAFYKPVAGTLHAKQDARSSAHVQRDIAEVVTRQVRDQAIGRIEKARERCCKAWY